jgi:hypothetical protein
MKPTYRHHVAALVVAAGVLLGAQAFADPPGRVARLNYLKGSVSFRPASVDDWTPATVNYPLTVGDHLWTETSSWVELHVGSTAIRLAPTTAFAFLNLDDRTTQIRLSEGALDVRVRNLDGSETFEIDTPSAAVALTRPGIYRVDVLPDAGSTRVTVRYGAASVTTDGPDFWVREGETAAIYGADNVSHEIYRAAAPDNWERWCRSRDEREDGAASVRYVSYEMTGYEDLDDNGSWANVPDYGWGWQPRVAYGWAPYRYGQWRWVWPWGWTWVDDAAWGFAPFHYGRWACLHNSWYWFPGTYVTRPVYAPALVAFFGGASWGMSIGFGAGHVGWFPLAPGEVWIPHYHASYGYIHNVNYTHVHDGRHIDYAHYDVSRGTYVNRAIPGAVTAVPRETFLGGRAVARDAVALDSRAAMRATVAGGSAPLAPRVDSVIGRRAGYVPRPPATVLDRTVVARSQPAAAPAPFAAQERAIQANGGRPLDEAGMARLRGESGDRGAAGPVRIAGARTGGTRGQPARADAAAGQVPAYSPSAPGGGSGSGAAGFGGARRSGERTVEGGRAESAPSVGGSVRPDVNDRPSWARPRAGGEVMPTNPRYGSEDRAGARGRTDSPTGNTPAAGGGTAGPPAGSGDARPRSGERPNARGESAAPANSDRPTFARPGSDTRPSGGDSPRPSSGDASRPAGARQHGGQQAPPPSSQPAGTAQPRSGGRGGDGAFFESSSRPSYGIGGERPGDGYRSDRGATAARPMPAAPQYRATPESRPVPEYHATPEYRAVPERRATPEYRSAPEYRATPPPAPQPRGDVRPNGGAVERRGGERTPAASPPAQAQPQSGGGQAAPRGARGHGRGE